MRSVIIAGLLLTSPILVSTTGYGQYCESDTEPDRREVDTSVNCVKDYFLHGHVSGHMRNYFMATINTGDLNDHYANATGGSVAYSTASWRGIHFGVKGIFTYNLFSSELAGNDSSGIRPAKWEQELFDLTHPTKRKDLDRLEELYIAYDQNGKLAKFGKIDIDRGPLLRRRDGRMKPFAYKGFWSNWKTKRRLHIYSGLLWGVSPRGMTEWYTFNEVIGILNNGQLNDSTGLNYHGQMGSKGLLINGVESKLGKHINIQFWNYYLHHVHNTSWLQTEYHATDFLFGMQYVFQFADRKQYLIAPQNRYIHESSHTLSGIIKVRLNDHFRWRIAQLFSIGDGTFLFPKEINRDSFYTSIRRSRMDGMGNSSVSLTGVSFLPMPEKNESFLFKLDLQYRNASGFLDHLHNKYQSPDYAQLNLSAKYDFKNELEGLHLNLLYTARISTSLPEEMTFDQQYYKTSLHHLNFVVDIVF